jgi:hypothetical protein
MLQYLCERPSDLEYFGQSILLVKSLAEPPIPTFEEELVLVVGDQTYR